MKRKKLEIEFKIIRKEEVQRREVVEGKCAEVKWKTVRIKRKASKNQK